MKTNRDGKNLKPEVWFPIPSDQGKTLVFKWATGLHSVEIPFTLKDVKIP